LNTFNDFNVTERLHKQLTVCGFKKPTEIQAKAIPHALLGKDIFATAQTGTGKTLAFLVPVIDKLFQQKPAFLAALVLVPTRELAIQVAEQFNQLAGSLLPPAALIIGGSPEKTQLRQLRAGAKLVIATPGRLEDLLRRGLVRLNHVQTLVLDEADRMLDMGFIPAIRRITQLLPKNRQTMCFSATAEPSVVSAVEEMLREPIRVAVGSTLRAADKVVLKAYEVDANQKSSLLARVVSEEEGQSLVFVATKRSSERVAGRLEKAGVRVAVIHGDRSQSQRNSALSAFQTRQVQALVATDVASRGIHVDGIAQVINYDLPNIPEDFVHRVGRTGRAGASGLATTFFTPLERRDFASLERALNLRMERIQTGTGLDREERGRPVDTGRLKLVSGGADAKGFCLEGEVMRRYAPR
jgi:ATP-dependent RNA helicase RhlE